MHLKHHPRGHALRRVELEVFHHSVLVVHQLLPLLVPNTPLEILFDLDELIELLNLLLVQHRLIEGVQLLQLVQ